MRSSTNTSKKARRSLRAIAVALAALTGGGAGVVLPFLASGCKERSEVATPRGPDGGVAGHAENKNHDGGANANRGLDGGALEGVRIGAMFMETPVYSDMEFPEQNPRAVQRRGQKDKVVRLGYLRVGASAPVIPEAHVKPNCPEGWYELVAGGFVCGRYATLDMNHPRIRLAPHAPFVDAALPYLYGSVTTHGTPLYRQVPSKKERVRFEPWLSPRPKVAPPKPPEDDQNTYADSEMDAGAAATLAGLAVASTRDPMGLGIDEDAGVPWYLREFDGGKPQITLDELRGEGPVIRRMVKGFFLSLDRDIKVNNVRWWKTTSGFVVPFDRIYPHKPMTDFHGIWLKDNAPPWPPPLASPDAPKPETREGEANDAGIEPGAPRVAAGAQDSGTPRRAGGRFGVAFVSAFRGRRYTVAPDRHHVTPGDPLARNSAVVLVGEAVNVGGSIYELTEGGFWVRSGEVVQTKPGPTPPDLAPGEKWIDVNLSNQTLVAFEGTTPVFATLVSSGRKDEEDPEKDHKTPPGTYRIWAKHIAATMDGDVASDGPYSIEDVPWIMYFQGSYALHGAFWHASFGHERSHGCVNLAPADARALFGWTDPPLPEGWHGVNATDGNPGTRVIVHEDPPK